MKRYSVDNVLRLFLARYSVKWQNPVVSNELHNYFGNAETCAFFIKHGLKFSEEKELRQFLSRGKLVTLPDDILFKVKNFAFSSKDLEDKLKDQTYALSYKQIENKIEQGDTLLEAPIIIKFKDGTYWFFSGRKRAYAARKQGVPVQYFLAEQKEEKKDN